MGRIPVTGYGAPADIGSPYGGWVLPVDLMVPGWCCYTVGVGGDISFDRALLDRFGAATVRAFEPVQSFVDGARAQMAGDTRFTADAVAIAPTDGPIRMQATHDPTSSSVSPVGLYDTRDYTEMAGRSIPSLMAQYGDERVDLLKLDIEGGEYELLPQLDLAALGIKVFAVQLHHNRSVRDARTLVAQLGERGYEAIGLRPVVKVTFVNRELLTAANAA